MISIIVYNEDTGLILRCVICQSETADEQCGDGEAWIEHERVDDTQWKVNPATKELEAR